MRTDYDPASLGGPVLEEAMLKRAHLDNLFLLSHAIKVFSSEKNWDKIYLLFTIRMTPRVKKKLAGHFPLLKYARLCLALIFLHVAG